MIQYSTLNVKLSNSQLNTCPEPGMKNGSQVTINLLSNIIGDANEESNFLHKFLLTNTQVSKIFKTFVNGLTTNIKSVQNGVVDFKYFVLYKANWFMKKLLT